MPVSIKMGAFIIVQICCDIPISPNMCNQSVLGGELQLQQYCATASSLLGFWPVDPHPLLGRDLITNPL